MVLNPDLKSFHLELYSTHWSLIKAIFKIGGDTRRDFRLKRPKAKVTTCGLFKIGPLQSCTIMFLLDNIYPDKNIHKRYLIYQCCSHDNDFREMRVLAELFTVLRCWTFTSHLSSYLSIVNVRKIDKAIVESPAAASIHLLSLRDVHCVAKSGSVKGTLRLPRWLRRLTHSAYRPRRPVWWAVKVAGPSLGRCYLAVYDRAPRFGRPCVSPSPKNFVSGFRIPRISIYSVTAE